MLNVHDEPAIIDAGQLLETMKSPVVEMPDRFRSVVPLFERTNAVVELVIPTLNAPKLMAVVDKVNGASPLPERFTTFPLELLAIVN